MAAVAEQGMLILPVVGLGLILGLYELMLIHRDVSFRGSHWLGHGLHSVIIMMVCLFIVLNTEIFFDLAGVASWGLPGWMTNVWVFRVLVGFILNIKMHATSAVIKGGAFRGGLSGSMAEHWTHTILVSALVVTSPLYWPILAPFLPSWMGGL